MQSISLLLILSGSLLTVLLIFVFLVGKALLSQIKSAKHNNKMYQDGKDRVKKFKDEGGVHKWVNMAVKSSQNGKVENTHVCEHTGYCPAIDSFIDMKHIKEIIQNRKKDEEFQAYKREVLLDLSDEYCVGNISELYDKMISIKKNFHIKKMNDFKKEIQAQFGENVHIVSNAEELNEALGNINDQKS